MASGGRRERLRRGRRSVAQGGGQVLHAPNDVVDRGSEESTARHRLHAASHRGRGRLNAARHRGCGPDTLRSRERRLRHVLARLLEQLLDAKPASFVKDLGRSELVGGPTIRVLEDHASVRRAEGVNGIGRGDRVDGRLDLVLDEVSNAPDEDAARIIATLRPRIPIAHPT